MDIKKDILTNYKKNLQVKDRERLEFISEIIVNTEFSYYNNFLNNMEVYNYYEEYSKEIIRKYNSELNIYNKRKNKYEYKYESLFNPCIEAGSEIENNEEKVIIYEGLIYKIYELFYKLNTNYDIFRKKDEKIQPITMLNLNNIISDEQEREIEFEITMSSNSRTNVIAEYISMLAIKFVIAHEIGHLYDGHCEYYLSLDKSSHGRFRMSRNQNNKITDRDLQTLEMDADAFAISRLVDEIESSLLNDERILKIVCEQSNIYLILGFAIHGIFYLLRQQEGFDDHQITHPPSMVREVMVFDAVKHSLKDRGKSYYDKVEKYFVEGMKLFDNTYSSVFNEKAYTLEELLKYKGTSYMQDLLDNWKVIKVQLEPFTRAKLAD